MPGIGGFILHSDRDFFDSFSGLRSNMKWADNYKEAFVQDPDLNLALYACASPTLLVSRITHLNRYESLLIGELYPADNFHSDRQIREAHLNILRGIIRSPAGTLNKINGAFVIAVWDTEKKRMIIANDAFGLLPINYYEGPEGVIFSSQLLAIKMLLSRPQTDQTALAEKIAIGFPLNGKTFIKFVRRLYPGAFLTIQNNKIKETRYYEPYYKYEGDMPLDQRLKRIKHVFFESTQKRIKTGERSAISLSGGFDTRLICAVTLSGRNNFEAITHGHSQSADVQIARQICKKLHIPHRVHELDNTEPALFFDWAVELNNKSEGFMNSASAFLVPYYKWLGKDFDVLIDGAGGAMYRRQYASTWEWPLNYQQDPALFTYRLFKKNLLKTDFVSKEYTSEIQPSIIEELRHFFDEHRRFGMPADLIDLFYLRQIVGLIYSADYLFQTHYINCREPFYDLETYGLARQFTPRERKALHIHYYILKTILPELEKFPLEFADFVVPYNGFRRKRLLYASVNRLTAMFSGQKFTWPAKYTRLFPVDRKLYQKIKLFIADSLLDINNFSPSIIRQEKLQEVLDGTSDSALDEQSLFHLLTLSLLLKWLNK